MNSEMGYVYILQSEDGYRKIGRTINPQRRIPELQIQLPHKVRQEFLLMCALGQERNVERLLHQKFSSKRVNGEWFKLTQEDLLWFCQNPIPLPIATSHAMCYCQACLKGQTDQDWIIQEVLGLS